MIAIWAGALVWNCTIKNKRQFKKDSACSLIEQAESFLVDYNQAFDAFMNLTNCRIPQSPI